jgi:hypothetical protein
MDIETGETNSIRIHGRGERLFPQPDWEFHGWILSGDMSIDETLYDTPFLRVTLKEMRLGYSAYRSTLQQFRHSMKHLELSRIEFWYPSESPTKFLAHLKSPFGLETLTLSEITLRKDPTKDSGSYMLVYERVVCEGGEQIGRTLDELIMKIDSMLRV